MVHAVAITFVVFVITSLVVAAGPAAPPEPRQDTTSPHPGKALLESMCSTCHDAKSVTASARTKAQWTETIDQMVRYGVQGGDYEVAQVTDYLLRNYSVINVNKAPAADLAVALDVPDTVAQALVTFREEQGTFKTIDDLKKVPGIDATRLDARAKQLRY